MMYHASLTDGGEWNRDGPHRSPRSARSRRWVMTGSVNGHGRDEMERAQPAGQVKRRGLIAGAAALAAGALAKASERLAQAADGGNFILGQNNSTASTTTITRSGSAGNTAFFVNNNANGGTGIFSGTRGAAFVAVGGENVSPASSPSGLGGIG